jgi:hypothetical protein
MAQAPAGQAPVFPGIVGTGFLGGFGDRLEWTPELRQQKWGQITFGC